MKNQEEYLFRPPARPGSHFAENRIRQVFLNDAKKARLDREYGRDSRGRKLHQFTVHLLRHAHIMHNVHIHRLPLPIVQKQVGHRTLKATSVYLKPSDEAVAEAYDSVRQALPEDKDYDLNA